MKNLILIRHSITEGNERRMYYGKTDLPLTEGGRFLCSERKVEISLPEGTLFGITGLLRTEETLRLLFGDVPFSVFPGFREMDMGVFEMRTYDMLKDTEAYQHWLSDTSGEYRIPGGESNRLFFSRVDRELENVLRRSFDSLCIVCHGGVISRIMNVCFPENPKSFYDWIPRPCRGYSLRFENNRPVGWTEI